MALIQWKQITSNLSGSGNLTGSLNLFGDQSISGDLTIGGTLIAQEYKTELISASILFESGSTLFGNTLDDTHLFTGSVNISGSLATSRSRVSFIDHPNATPGQALPFLRTSEYLVNFDNATRTYGYAGIAIDNNDPEGVNPNNALAIYTYDSGSTRSTVNYGGELIVGPIRTHIRQYVSGSDTLANISVQELPNSQSLALVYGNRVVIGGYIGDDIRIGNSTAAISATGSLRLGLNGVDQYFSVEINNIPQVKVNESGILQLTSKSAVSASAGSIYYSSSGEFYLGFN